MQEILQEHSGTDVVVIAIWEPILPTDMSRPGTAILGHLADARAQQYWDPERYVAGDLARAIAKNRDFPRPSCCILKGYYWDLAAIFPKGAEWNESLPLATFINGPVVDVRDDLRKALVTTK